MLTAAFIALAIWLTVAAVITVVDTGWENILLAYQEGHFRDLYPLILVLFLAALTLGLIGDWGGR